MIGPKKLSTIRQELRRVIRTSGKNPLDLLEDRTSAGKPLKDAQKGDEVRQCLEQFLETPLKPQRRAKRLNAKK